MASTKKDAGFAEEIGGSGEDPKVKPLGINLDHFREDNCRWGRKFPSMRRLEAIGPRCL